MQPQALLAATWQQLRRERTVWTAGLLGAAGNLLLGFWLRQAARPALWREPLRLWWESQVIPVVPLLLWGGGAVLLAVMAWLLALRAEGTLIAVVLGSQEPWRQGRRWLVRFVAIDTLVFLPLLLLGILVLFLSSLLLVASVIAALRSAQPRAMLLGGWGVTALCVTPLVVLLLTVGLVTLLLRLLAFRAVAAEGLGARSALRRAWSVVRSAPGATALTMLLLWGLAYLSGTLLGTIVILLHLATAVPELAVPAAGRSAALLQGGLALLEWVPRAALFAFLGLGWTHAYLRLADGEAAHE
jgi:hypothetical protein